MGSIVSVIHPNQEDIRSLKRTSLKVALFYCWSLILQLIEKSKLIP